MLYGFDQSPFDDLLQEVLLKFWLHLSKFRSESTFRGWMTRVAINEAYQSRRREQRRPICQALGGFESLLQALTRAETTQIVRKALVELPAKYRRVLIFRHLEQLSLRETPQWLRSSVPAAKSRLRVRLVVLAALQRSRNPGIGRPGWRSFVRHAKP